MASGHQQNNFSFESTNRDAARVDHECTVQKATRCVGTREVKGMKICPLLREQPHRSSGSKPAITTRIGLSLPAPRARQVVFLKIARAITVETQEPAG